MILARNIWSPCGEARKYPTPLWILAFRHQQKVQGEPRLQADLLDSCVLIIVDAGSVGDAVYLSRLQLVTSRRSDADVKASAAGGALQQPLLAGL